MPAPTTDNHSTLPDNSMYSGSEITFVIIFSAICAAAGNSFGSSQSEKRNEGHMIYKINSGGESFLYMVLGGLVGWGFAAAAIKVKQTVVAKL